MRPTNKGNLPPVRRACGKCGRLGHIVRTCQNNPKAYDKIGVEIEGWWQTDRWSQVQRIADNWHMSGSEDGSLEYDDDDVYKAYEFRTRPGSLGEAISQVTALYPDACHQSAGMHVHMSFADVADTIALASVEFLTYFRQRWEAWGARMEIHRGSQFWSRLRGENSYCKANNTRYLARPCSADRYQQINWVPWGRHKTVELRLLPLFRDARIAISALEEWVSIVEDFIAQVSPMLWAKLDGGCDESFEAVGTYNREIDLESIPSEIAYLPEIAVEIPLDTVQGQSWSGRRMEMPAVRTIEADVIAPGMESSERTADVDLVPTNPVTPGHTRLFGARAQRAAARLRDLGIGV